MSVIRQKIGMDIEIGQCSGEITKEAGSPKTTTTTTAPPTTPTLVLQYLYLLIFCD